MAMLPLETKRRVAQAMVEVQFAKGDAVIREGEPGSAFYFVFSGELHASKRGDVVKRYRRGGYFGERALLHNENRAATVTCTSEECQLLMIDRETFDLVRRDVKTMLRQRGTGSTDTTASSVRSVAPPPNFGRVQREDLS